MEQRFKELIVLLSGYSDNKKDLSQIKKAWRFAKLAHIGQKRYSGEPYALHGLETAVILALWKLDLDSIITGILHDTVEDGAASFSDIEKEFGQDVSRLVDGVTKVSHIKLRASIEEEFVENLRKMFLAMAKDLRVVMVKLADRLHNMRTLSAVPKEKQAKIARETLEIYAPLAERLGMGELKAELDDLAFLHIFPEDYKNVKKALTIRYKKVEIHIKKMKRMLLKKLADEKIKAKIGGRKKHLYSLWKKLQRPEINWDYEKIYDIVALRIILSTIPECYTALGIVHNLFKPIPHLGVSDFIAQPKPNGYRSIHTKVFGPSGNIVEVQIRTQGMHEQAEHGVAAHWAYVEAKSKKIKDEILEKEGIRATADKFSWIKQLAEWQKEISDTKEFLQAVKFDALKHRIFVFSPKGDVFDLPEGATPVDFAYTVHTGLGEYIKAAKVNGKIAPLNFKLGSGQVVEIIKSKNPKPPSADWLEFVVTTQARKEINKNLRKLSSKE